MSAAETGAGGVAVPFRAREGRGFTVLWALVVSIRHVNAQAEACSYTVHAYRRRPPTAYPGEAPAA